MVDNTAGAINLSDVASATVKGKDLVISTGAGRVYTLTGADKAKSTEWAMALCVVLLSRCVCVPASLICLLNGLCGGC